MAKFDYFLVHIPQVREDSVVLLCCNQTPSWSIYGIDAGVFKKKKNPDSTPHDLLAEDQEARKVDPHTVGDKDYWINQINEENSRRGIGVATANIRVSDEVSPHNSQKIDKPVEITIGNIVNSNSPQGRVPRACPWVNVEAEILR